MEWSKNSQKFSHLLCVLSSSICEWKGWVHLCFQRVLHPKNPCTYVFCQSFKDGGHVRGNRHAAHFLCFFTDVFWNDTNSTKSWEHWSSFTVAAPHVPLSDQAKKKTVRSDVAPSMLPLTFCSRKLWEDRIWSRSDLMRAWLAAAVWRHSSLWASKAAVSCSSTRV